MTNISGFRRNGTVNAIHTPLIMGDVPQVETRSGTKGSIGALVVRGSKSVLLLCLVLSLTVFRVVFGMIFEANYQSPSSLDIRLHIRGKEAKESKEGMASNFHAIFPPIATNSPLDAINEKSTDAALFADFVREHGKTYVNREEYSRRHQIYHQSLSTVLKHNAASNQSSWKMGINQFADHVHDELPLGLDKRALRNHHRTRTTSSRNFFAPLPDSVDWRKKGVTTPVKNQGHCGSCWAFASTAALESHIAINTGTLLELSVQELVTCAPNPNHCGGTGGCNGNTAELAYDFVSSGRGIVSEWDWGYISGKNHTVPACELPSDDNATIPGAIASIDGYVSIEHNDYFGLLEAVATVGPVVVNVDAANWHLYESGIFDESLFSNSTSRDINHVVVVEGYGTETVIDPDTGETYSRDYWLVRNSWGPLWGEDGYIRLKRESNAATSDCKPDTSPADGIACVGPDDNITPPVVDVCGTSGVLYDALYPTGAHLLKPSITAPQ